MREQAPVAVGDPAFAGIRRNSLNLSLQYSTGVSARGGGLVSGWKGVLFRDWTVMPSFNLASEPHHHLRRTVSTRRSAQRQPAGRLCGRAGL